MTTHLLELEVECQCRMTIKFPMDGESSLAAVEEVFRQGEDDIADWITAHPEAILKIRAEEAFVATARVYHEEG